MFEPRRLHPVAALLNFLRRLREILIPVVLFLIIGGGGEDRLFNLIYIIVLGMTIFLLLIGGILHWYRYTYRIEDGELRIEYGIFVRKKRYIPFERIQTIDVSSGIIQRIFGLVKVQVETAGGGMEAEAVLTAITERKAEELGAIIKTQKTHANESQLEVEENEQRYNISLKELLIASSTSGGIGIVLSGLIAFITQVDELIPYDLVIDQVEQFIRIGAIIFIVLLSGLALLVAWVIGTVIVMLKYANFTLVKRDQELVVTRGLIERRQLTIPLSRIQAIRVVENPLRQLLGFATVHVESAGGTVDKGEQFSTVLFPLIKRSQVGELLRQFVPEYEKVESLRSVPKRALPRYLVRTTILFLPLLFSIFFTSWGYLSAVIIIFALFWGYLRYKDASWNVSGAQLVLRFRTVNRITVFMKRKRIQALEEQYSYFQRKRELATIKASIRSSITGMNFSVIDIKKSDCERMMQWYSHEKRETNSM